LAARTTSSWRRSRRLISILLVVILIGIILGGTYYFRPVMLGMAFQQVGMWIQGIHRNDVQLGPYRIHYLVSGEGRPLVLVHGLGVRSEIWLPLIPQFTAKGFRVYAPDLLGYGRSDRPDVDYTISLQADIVRQFLDSQGLQQTDLAGWSMGGWISLKLAADSPQRVRRLVLLDSAGMRFDAVNRLSLRPKTPEQLAHLMEVLSPKPRAIPGFLARDILRVMNEQDWVVGRSLDSMIAGKDLMDGRLEGVTMPVLIVWGRQDVLTPLAIAEQMHREMPQSVLFVAEGCGHLAPIECRDQIGPEMQKFLTNPELNNGK
jgi:pimeloyl-ACP methyl ester carboxylesterase